TSSLAIWGQSAAVGVRGDGSEWDGVFGNSTSTTGGAGGDGLNPAGNGGERESQTNNGFYGRTSASGPTGAAAIFGDNLSDGIGVAGRSESGAGIYARSNPDF